MPLIFLHCFQQYTYRVPHLFCQAGMLLMFRNLRLISILEKNIQSRLGGFWIIYTLFLSRIISFSVNPGITWQRCSESLTFELSLLCLNSLNIGWFQNPAWWFLHLYKRNAMIMILFIIHLHQVWYFFLQVLQSEVPEPCMCKYLHLTLWSPLLTDHLFQLHTDHLWNIDVLVLYIYLFLIL